MSLFVLTQDAHVSNAFRGSARSSCQSILERLLQAIRSTSLPTSQQQGYRTQPLVEAQRGGGGDLTGSLKGVLYGVLLGAQGFQWGPVRGPLGCAFMGFFREVLH